MSDETLGNPDQSGASATPAPAAAPVPSATPAPEPAAIPSIIDNTVPEPQVPQSWPDNWRPLMVGEDESALTQANRFNSPQDVWNSYREAQKLISSHKTPLARPTAESTPEALAAYRTENGIPAEAKEYKIDFGDGTAIGDDMREQFEGYLDYAHENHLSNDQVNSTLQWYAKDVELQHEAVAELNSQAEVDTITSLKAEWGAEYKGNVNAITSLFTEAPQGTMAALKSSAGPDGLMFANNPDNIKWLVGLAKQINPDVTLVPPGPDQMAGIDTQIKEIQGWMTSRDPVERNKYWQDTTVQDKLTRLTEQKKRAG